jgi:beta-N-acetylhexosaminidase
MKQSLFLASLALSLFIKPSEVLATSPDSLDIKIGQMIMIGINDRTHLKETDALISELNNHKMGGVILFEKNINPTNSKSELKKLIATMKSAAPIPLLVSIDEEGGIVHRLKEKYGFVSMPSAADLGRLNKADTTLFYNRRLAAQLNDLGINFNYAPTLDLAINPMNSVLVKRGRCFSRKEEIVSKHALLCIQAHHENNVKTILKHFPGHGSSTADSHLGIVDVTNTWNFEELIPYNTVLQSGTCDAIMTAHIINKNWDESALPATLSHKVITGMLRGMLQFKGVVFSDDMQMNAISQNYGFEKGIEMAINAGVDIVMFGNNVSKDVKSVTATEVHQIIKKLVKDGTISQNRINESYVRITRLKQKTFSEASN